MANSHELLITADGSASLYLPELDETYHSRHGALQESMHVFIEAGLREAIKEHSHLNILECGFGTGLNALLSYLQLREREDISIRYVALEPHPIPKHLAEKLSESMEQFGAEARGIFKRMHESEAGISRLSERFELHRLKEGLMEHHQERAYHLIYYDAFAPRVQPELWTEEVFRHLYSLATSGSIWVSYCAKGSVRRALIAAGFSCERLPGPKGKREMLRGRVVSG
jgi:tRNA U34 5-methylaminomethyl-2-thiouridine-forming methyltransferase MnmC